MLFFHKFFTYLGNLDTRNHKVKYKLAILRVIFTISVSLVLNNFKNSLFIPISREQRSDLVREHSSKAYSNIGINLKSAEE